MPVFHIIIIRKTLLRTSRWVSKTTLGHFKTIYRVILQGEFPEFQTLFEEESGLYYGSYWEHLKQAWKLREKDNVKFIWFEDMKQDLAGVITELGQFLEVPLSSVQIKELSEQLTFNEMKKNQTVNFFGSQFLRKGEVGDWRNYFDKQTSERWDWWIQEKLEGTGIVMKGI